MATNNIKQQIIDDYDFVISEGDNSHISLRKVKWSENSDVKLDLRHYIMRDKEIMGKGISFSLEAADTLAETLVENGSGSTKKLLKSIMARKDYKGTDDLSLYPDDEEEEDDSDVEYFDIRSEMMG